MKVPPFAFLALTGERKDIEDLYVKALAGETKVITDEKELDNVQIIILQCDKEVNYPQVKEMYENLSKKLVGKTYLIMFDENFTKEIPLPLYHFPCDSIGILISLTFIVHPFLLPITSHKENSMTDTKIDITQYVDNVTNASLIFDGNCTSLEILYSLARKKLPLFCDNHYIRRKVLKTFLNIFY